MRSFWNRERGLEAELRANRPQPRDEFVRTLAERVPARRRSTGAVRVAMAMALSLVMLASVIGFGGVGYAAGPVTRAASVVKKVFVPKNGLTVNANSSAQQQYPGNKKPTVKKKKRKARVAGVQARSRPSFTG